MNNRSAGYLEVCDLVVRFHSAGDGDPVLLLHGWGDSIEGFLPLLSDLQREYAVHAIDLPGFGKSAVPDAAWGVAEYASLTLKAMDQLAIDRPHMIAHSFGGRVAIFLAAHHPGRVGKLVLVDSAGIRLPPRTFLRLKLAAVRLGNSLGRRGGVLGKSIRKGIIRGVQSRDYATSKSMRETLVKVVNEDLSPLLPLIQAPTLLIWGRNDKEVPLIAAWTMSQHIPDSRLMVIEHAGHFPHVDQFGQFRLVVRRFLKEANTRGINAAI